MGTTPITQALLAQLEAIASTYPAPAIAGLHVPADLGPASAGARDAAFCAIELQDGAFGLSYLMLGDTLRSLASNGNTRAIAGRPEPTGAGAAFRQQRPVGAGLALACINALTDSVWRRIGYEPPPAGNSLGDVVLSATDHLGMIGFFPPLVRQVQALGARLTVVELDAGHGAAPAGPLSRRRPSRWTARAWPTATVVVGTSTMLLNDTLDAMLAAAPRAQRLCRDRPVRRAVARCLVRARRHLDGRHPHRRWRWLSRRHGEWCRHGVPAHASSRSRPATGLAGSSLLA